MFFLKLSSTHSCGATSYSLILYWNYLSDFEFFRYSRDPKTKGREVELDADGNKVNRWVQPNGVQLIAESNEDDFDEFITSYKHIFIMWYTQSCIRCFEIVQPEFLKLAESISEVRGNVKLAVIDGQLEKTLRLRFDINAYVYLI